VLVYCKPTESTYNFLAAVSSNGPWVQDQFSSNDSAIPPGLESTNTVLSHRDNYQYTGPTEGNKDGLVTAIGDDLNWIGFDAAQPFSFDDFFVDNAAGTDGPTTLGIDNGPLSDDESPGDSSSDAAFHNRSPSCYHLLLLALFIVL
jgi:hypothetical protein